MRSCCTAQLADEQATSPLLIDVRQYVPQTHMLPTSPPEGGAPAPSLMRVTIRDAPLGEASAAALGHEADVPCNCLQQVVSATLSCTARLQLECVCVCVCHGCGCLASN